MKTKYLAFSLDEHADIIWAFIRSINHFFVFVLIPCFVLREIKIDSQFSTETTNSFVTGGNTTRVRQLDCVSLVSVM